MLHFGFGRSQIEWKLKVKTVKTKFQFSHRAKIGQNDHSNLLIIEVLTVKSGANFPFLREGSHNFKRQGPRKRQGRQYSLLVTVY